MEPATPLDWNWHLTLICDLIEREARRIDARKPKTKDYIINVPPRSLKSSILVKFCIAYVWSLFPAEKFLCASYSADLALEHAVFSRRVMQTPWYQTVFGTAFAFTGDQNVKSYFENDQTGYRISTSVGGTGTGRGGDWELLDDPLSADEAQSEVFRKRAIDWYMQTWQSRLNDQEIGVRFLIMQRLHENDLTGYLLATQAENFYHICLPAKLAKNVSPPEVKRYYIGGYLFPKRLSPRYLAVVRADPNVGEYVYSGQYQQSPAPQEGGIFKKYNWRFWRPRGMMLPPVQFEAGDEIRTCEVVELPASFEDVINSWDCSFKDRKKSDDVCGGVLGKLGEELFLLDLDMGKKSFTATSEAVLRMSRKYPETSAVCIEDAANGPAVVSDLAKIVPGLRAISTHGDSKFARALPLSRRQEAGQVYLPHPALTKWVNTLIEQFAGFPNATHDDAVDMLSQANTVLGGRRVWQRFSSLMVQGFRVNFREISPLSTLVISQWVGQDVSTSLLMGLWSAEQRRLWIWDEVRTPESHAQIVLREVLRRVRRDSQGYLASISRFEWYGNPEMYAQEGVLSGGDVVESYRRANVNVQENLSYDESGAITLVSRLIEADALRVHPRCTVAAKEIAGWPIERGKAVREYYYARALCNMVAFLVESGRLARQALVPKAFSREKEEMIRRLDEADSRGRLDEYMRGVDARGNVGPNSDPNAWMTA